MICVIWCKGLVFLGSAPAASWVLEAVCVMLDVKPAKVREELYSAVLKGTYPARPCVTQSLAPPAVPEHNPVVPAPCDTPHHHECHRPRTRAARRLRTTGNPQWRCSMTGATRDIATAAGLITRLRPARCGDCELRREHRLTSSLLQTTREFLTRLKTYDKDNIPPR